MGDTSQIIIQLLMGLVFAIPTLFFIGIGLFYISKVGTKTDGLLFLIGNIVILLSIIINKILFVQFIVYQNMEATTYSYVLYATNILSFIGSILFAIGLYLLVKKAVKLNNTKNAI
ncbi:hypothetical protein M0D21_04375 [Aquimarina sp. D1M17]|uniref:hypothetical protein n=1 Tax=Aquimarina acroporae TaxID=2937283 RepID=UPI0020BE0452|nr:hypothetical protein [Aquimarina acroporae]MCK8520785.1 hypothetical protein [Aquimarina acroporae]